MKKILLILAVFFGLGAPAEAKNWVIDYGASKLGFIGRQGSTPFEGHFKTFRIDTNFDPAHPETSTIRATITINSISTGDEERDSMLPQADWFSSAKFPQAAFETTRIKKTGDNAFEAQATLTIKDIAKVITLPFTFVEEGDHWRATGKTTLVRSDFKIGEGQWADESTVKFNVDVTLDIVAKPAP